MRERYGRDMETVTERTRANLLENGLEPRRLESASERLLVAHRVVRESPPEEAVDVWVDDEPLTVGGRELEPIYAPGHHISHVCFGTTLDGDRVIFSGDMAIRPFRAPSLLVNFDDDGVRDSVRQFRSLARPTQNLRLRSGRYPGHGPVHDQYQECLDRSITDLENKCEQCLERIESSRTTAFQIAAERAGTKREISRIFAETVGLVGYLEHHSQVQSAVEDGIRYYRRT